MAQKAKVLFGVLVLVIVLLAVVLFLSLGKGTKVAGIQDQQTQTALVPKPMAAKEVAKNPYMADSDNAIHNDIYATDVTDAVAPLGIDSQLTTSVETQNMQAPSAAFYDTKGHAVTPIWGALPL